VCVYIYIYSARASRALRKAKPQRPQKSTRPSTPKLPPKLRQLPPKRGKLPPKRGKLPPKSTKDRKRRVNRKCASDCNTSGIRAISRRTGRAISRRSAKVAGVEILYIHISIYIYIYIAVRPLHLITPNVITPSALHASRFKLYLTCDSFQVDSDEFLH
jgi:hypothetical protein